MSRQSSTTDGAHKFGPSAMLCGIADGVALAGGYLAALCIVALTFLILAEIAVAFLSRFIPSLPSGIGIGWEYSAYLMGGAFLLGSGMTLRAGQLIRVELLLRINNDRFARVGEIASALVGTIVCTFLAFSMSNLTLRMLATGEASQDSFTPLWIPQSALTLGATILALQMIARALACVMDNPLERPELGAATQIE